MDLPEPLPNAYRLGWRDWLALPETSQLCEILDGEVVMSPSPTPLHQSVAGEIYVALRNHVVRQKLGRVFIAPLGVRLSESDVVEPDVLVVLAPNASRISDTGILGAPDLVVEVLSPGTAVRDVGIKRALYEKHGVSEYWIADPIARAVTVLALGPEGYREAGRYGADATLRSPTLPGLEVPLTEVFPAT